MTEATARYFIASVALSTTLGVFVHDSHIDRAATTALVRAEATDNQASKLSPELHVHGEHPRFTKKPGAKAPDPRDRIRNREQKKVSPKLTKTGQAAYYVPA